MDDQRKIKEDLARPRSEVKTDCYCSNKLHNHVNVCSSYGVSCLMGLLKTYCLVSQQIHCVSLMFLMHWCVSPVRKHLHDRVQMHASFHSLTTMFIECSSLYTIKLWHRIISNAPSNCRLHEEMTVKVAKYIQNEII